MTSIGTGYDLSNSTFSPDGRVFQVEYAAKAVENSGTSIGIRTKNCVVLASEKLVTSKLLVPRRNLKLGSVDRHIGVAMSGLGPDGVHFLGRARDEANSWRQTYKVPISGKVNIPFLSPSEREPKADDETDLKGIDGSYGRIRTGIHIILVCPSFWNQCHTRICRRRGRTRTVHD